MRASVERFSSSEDYRYSQRVAVAVRWLVLGSWLAIVNYRAEFDGTLVALDLLAVPLILANAYVNWRINKNRPVTAPYVYALSLLDVGLVTTGIAITSPPLLFPPTADMCFREAVITRCGCGTPRPARKSADLTGTALT